MHDYKEVTIHAGSALQELLIAELNELGYDSFVEAEDALAAYIPSNQYEHESLSRILMHYHILDADVHVVDIPATNWNAQWESDYQPIYIENILCIHADFHQPDPYIRYNVVIRPQNTFGTGHHQTTQLVLKLMLKTSWDNLGILDFGCGTGILGICALKLGAKSVVAIDIDPWCEENVPENVNRNEVEGLKFVLGDKHMIPQSNQFDAVLANINKNILNDAMNSMAHVLRLNGTLFISGFYESDLQDITDKAQQYGLELQESITSQNWCAASFVKTT